VAAQTGRAVVLIDDDEAVRRALRRLLRSAGLNVETFAAAEEFLATADGPAPACLVLDVRMPGMGGLGLQKHLAAAGRHIPIVFITAHEDEAARRAALQAGAVDFLHKPFDDRALLDSIARALARGPNEGACPRTRVPGRAPSPEGLP
jgi:FixJ family two-component response regulator